MTRQNKIHYLLEKEFITRLIIQAYLKNRNHNIGKKLSMSNGKEMTVAQKRALMNTSENIIHEGPDGFDIYHTPHEPNDGHYRWDDKDTIPFIVNQDITEVYFGYESDSHVAIQDDIYFDKEDTMNGLDPDSEEYEIAWEPWERKSSFHGRIWTTPRVISFWKLPTPSQLHSILNLFQKENSNLNINNIINSYDIEVSYDKQTGKSNFIPVKDYLNGGKAEVDNNFDLSTVHTKVGETTPEMQAYLKNRSRNRGNKLGKPNNKREVTPAEYNYYRKYGMGESVNRGRMTLYHGTDYWGMLNVITDGVIDAQKGRQTGETKGMNWFFTEYRDNYSRGYVFSIDISEEELKSYDGHPMSNLTVATYDPIPIANHNFRIVEAFGIEYETIQRMWDIAGKKVEDEYERIFLLFERMQKLSIARDNELIDINNPIMEQILKQLLGINKMKEFGILENKQINEVEAEDLRLKSFETKDELHPKFWVNDKLNSRVRLRLLDIADDFIDNLAVDWVKPKDIVFTGSLANYNWSKYSDIDLHIIMKYSDVYKKTEFVEDYFKGKKDLWANEHENLKIYGYPVEVYVEDSENEAESTGVYSLCKNKWIKKPDDFQDAKLNEEYIKRYASQLMTKIDNIEEKLKDEKDEHKIETAHNQLTALAKKIKNMRQESLKKSGEMGSGNIIFKLLRRTDYIKKMYDLINSSYDSINSIKENKI